MGITKKIQNYIFLFYIVVCFWHEVNFEFILNCHVTMSPINAQNEKFDFDCHPFLLIVGLVIREGWVEGLETNVGFVWASFMKKSKILAN